MPKCCVYTASIASIIIMLIGIYVLRFLVHSLHMILLNSISLLLQPGSSLSIASGMESEPAETESKTYNVTVTLHSGNKLAIRDRTGMDNYLDYISYQYGDLLGSFSYTGSSDPYVKIKCGRFKYRSAVVHRCLNPEWNETFSFRTSDLSTPLVARVFDHDFGSLDDYMGGQSVNLEAYTTSE